MLVKSNQSINQINKQTEKMYALLAICLTLHPQRIDESILSQLKDKYGDRMNKMQKGCVQPSPPPLGIHSRPYPDTPAPSLAPRDKGEFGDMFTFACPKFLNPVPPVMTPPVASSDKQPPKEQKNFSKVGRASLHNTVEPGLFVYLANEHRWVQLYVFVMVPRFC